MPFRDIPQPLRRRKPHRHSQVIHQEAIDSDIGLVVETTAKEYERAAIRILLDNIPSADDVQKILAINRQLTQEAEQNSKFMKKCNKCCAEDKPCTCNDKEYFLIGNALQKFDYIATYGPIMERPPGMCEKEQCKTIRNVVALSEEAKMTFKKLHSKLRNMRKFYPGIYYSQNNILEEFTKDDALQKMDEKLLNLMEHFEAASAKAAES